MLDINSCNSAVKGSWIRRLLNPENSKWKNLTWLMLNTDELINSNCPEHNIKSKSPFHTQIFKACAQIKSFGPKSFKEIIIQSICNNKYILIGNKPINELSWYT